MNSPQNNEDWSKKHYVSRHFRALEDLRRRQQATCSPVVPGDPFWDHVIADSLVRLAVVRQNPLLFFQVYFAECMEYQTALFQKEIFGILQDQNIKFAVIEAFRNSAKTTIVNKAYVLWSILGEQQKKHVLILAQTQEQGRLYLTNIKRKMSEPLLRADLGPFEEPKEEWRINSVVLPKYGARITVASIDQPIRGILHEQHRPDLIICDDLESSNSVKSQEMREKLYGWFTKDILPMGDTDTRTIVIGTRLHEDSLMMRLRNDIEEKRRDGIIRSYPLLDDAGNISWPGKFSDMKTVEAERMRIGNEHSWKQEYLLELVPEDSQVVLKEWLHYYDYLPITKEKRLDILTSVDPAIGGGKEHDPTAIVSAEAYMVDGELYIYILPNPVNQQMNYPDMLDRIKLVSRTLGGGWQSKLIYEDVAFQKAGIQDLERCGFYVQPFKPGGTDKRARLVHTTGMVKSGKVLFPRKGVEELIDQLLYFPNTKHDDLVDAFSMLVLQSMIDYPGGSLDVIDLTPDW